MKLSGTTDTERITAITTAILNYDLQYFNALRITDMEQSGGSLYAVMQYEWQLYGDSRDNSIYVPDKDRLYMKKDSGNGYFVYARYDDVASNPAVISLSLIHISVTGRYDITSSGAALDDAYYTPIDHTDVTAINNPDKYCELMNLGALDTEENVERFTNHWRVDWSKPVSESGQSNIYWYYNSFGDSRDQPGDFYKIVKVSRSRPVSYTHLM